MDRVFTECVAVTAGKDNQSQGDGAHMNGLQTEELMQLREEVEELRKQNALLQTQLGDKETLVNTLVSKSILTASQHCVSVSVRQGLTIWIKSRKIRCIFPETSLVSHMHINRIKKLKNEFHVGFNLLSHNITVMAFDDCAQENQPRFKRQTQSCTIT